jgi:hypothetical protein
VRACVRACVCVCVFAYVHMCLCACAHVCMWMHVSVCQCFCACLYMCARNLFFCKVEVLAYVSPSDWCRYISEISLYLFLLKLHRRDPRRNSTTAIHLHARGGELDSTGRWSCTRNHCSILQSTSCKDHCVSGQVCKEKERKENSFQLRFLHSRFTSLNKWQWALRFQFCWSM